jgi:hypothetical protein
MKTAFKIVPELSTNREYHLLAEAGRDTISLVWYSKEPLKIEGLFIYQTGKDITGQTLAENIQTLLANENLPHYHSCSICYNFKESLLIPAEYYTAGNQAEMLHCIYGDNVAATIFSEPVKNVDAFNIYRVPASIHEAMINRFFAANIQHSNSLLVPSYLTKDIYCIVYNSYIKVFLFSNGNLQLLQLYDYNTPADVAWHLLNVCTQHHVSPAEVELTLSGFIDQRSNLYEELYRYFLHIKMEEWPEGVGLAEEIRTYPEHFFSFLITLVKCVS